MCQETRLVHVRYVTKVEREAEVARPTPEARPRKKGQVVALAAISRAGHVKLLALRVVLS